MKKLSFFLLSGVAVLTCNADQISESQAQAVASKYLNVATGHSRLLRAATVEHPVESPYYVFNSASGSGFVIVSGDDEMTELVGYSTTGRFDPTNVPSNLQAYLDQYAGYVGRVQRGEVTAIKRELQAGTPVVGPLIKTKWDQTSPYNDLCPIDQTISTRPKSYTGCVATAMAQVMYHHQWPKQGKGKHTYTVTTLNKELSVDFSQSVYDWQNMKLTYRGNETAAQNAAVARLMYDCGVSVNMKYSGGAGSGAFDMSIPSGVARHFGYKAQIHFRSAYTKKAYLDLIKHEIDNNRPVVFGGATVDGSGHEFVVDGYDTNDFISVNWGWSGMSDGFFDMAIMNPSDLGAGGGTGAGGFSEMQSIITMEKDPTMAGDPGQKPLMLVPASVSGGKSGYIYAKQNSYKKGDVLDFFVEGIWNSGEANYVGDLSVGIYDKDFNLVAVSKALFPVEIPAFAYSQGVAPFKMDEDLSGLADGNYTVWLVSREKADGKEFEWMRVGAENMLNMRVYGDLLVFGIGDMKLSLNGGIVADKTPIYPGDKVNFKFGVRNEGLVPVSGTMTLEFKMSNGRPVMKKSMKVDLAENKVTDVSMEATLSGSVFRAGYEYEVIVKSFEAEGKTFEVAMPEGGLKFRVEDPSGVAELSGEAITVEGGIGEITVIGGESVEIYTVGGMLVGRERIAHVPAGLYLVKVDGQVKKVIVR